jgi:ABC-2 type transport system permease protein
MVMYIKYLLILLKSQMEYKGSFILLSIGQFLVPFFMIAGMYFMFERFGNIRGWGFYEVALCFSIIHMAFSLSECFARGFDAFSNLVTSGDFDRILVRPRTTVLQVLGSRFEFSRVGRLLQSFGVLVWAILNLPIKWTIIKVITLFLMILSGVFIFVGIFILAATLCFWTIQTLEIANIFTDGGREMAQYPINIYSKLVTKFFTFIIPFATVNYFPLLFLLGKAHGNALVYMGAPFIGILFIVPCLFIWSFGVRHYRSTGS